MKHTKELTTLQARYEQAHQTFTKDVNEITGQLQALLDKYEAELEALPEPPEDRDDPHEAKRETLDNLVTELDALVNDLTDQSDLEQLDFSAVLP